MLTWAKVIAIVFAVVIWNLVFLLIYDVEFASTICFPQDDQDFSVCPPQPVLWQGLVIWNALPLLAGAAGVLTYRLVRRRREYD